MKKIIIILIMFISSTLNFYDVNSETVDFVKGDVNHSGTLSTGISYESFSAITYTDSNLPGNQNISVVKAESGVPFMVMPWSKIYRNSIVKGNLIEIAQDFELKNPGYEVIAGINGDYYNMTTGTPINALVQNGDVIKYSNFYLDRYFSVGFTNDENLYITNKNNNIESDFYLKIYNNDNLVVKEIKIQGFNRIPLDNNTAIYYKPLNSLVINDATIYDADIIKDTNFGSLFIEAVIHNEVSQVNVNNNKITIVTKDDDLVEYLQQGYKVRIQKYMSGVYNGIDNIIGVGSQPLVEGTILEFDQINDQSVDFAKARNPRSAFGFSDTGDFYITTFDGRQTNMDGVNLREQANVMKNLGCHNAFNLDGGGSTQLVIKENDEFKILNSPSDIPYRKVSNGLFLVRPKVLVDIDLSNLTSNSFDFDFSITDNKEIIISSDVYINDVLLECNQQKMSIEGLDDGSINYINIEIKVENGPNDYTSFMVSKRIDLSQYILPEEPHEKQPPSEFNFTVEEDISINGFNLFVTFTDPDDTFVKMYLIYDDEKILLRKRIGGYVASIPNAADNTTYAFNIEYYYVLGSINPVSRITDSPYEYVFQSNSSLEPDEPLDDNYQLNFSIIYYGVGGLAITVLSAYILFRFKRGK